MATLVLSNFIKTCREALLERRQQPMLFKRRVRRLGLGLARTVLGTLGIVIPYALKRRLALVHPRFSYLMVGDGDFIIGDYLGEFRVHIDVKSAIEREMLAGVYDPDALSVLRDNVAEGDTCFDIGANVGGLAFALAQTVGTQGHVIAFEPGPPFFRRLEKNLALNPRLARVVRAENLGVAEKKGMLLWQEDPHFAGNAWMLGGVGQPIPVIALDDYVSENQLNRVDFIKVDVEGMEWEVLQGAVKTLQRFRPRILMETLMEFETIRKRPVRRESLELLNSLGYDIFGIHAGGEMKPARYPDLTANSFAIPK